MLMANSARRGIRRFIGREDFSKGLAFVVDRTSDAMSTAAHSLNAGSLRLHVPLLDSHSTGLMSITGVPSMASMGPTRRRFLLILRTVT